jgi:hypothetical protein
MKFILTYQQEVVFDCESRKAARMLLKDFREGDVPLIDVAGGGISEGSYSYKSSPAIKVISFRKLRRGARN